MELELDATFLAKVFIDVEKRREGGLKCFTRVQLVNLVSVVGGRGDGGIKMRNEERECETVVYILK